MSSLIRRERLHTICRKAPHLDHLSRFLKFAGKDYIRMSERTTGPKGPPTLMNGELSLPLLMKSCRQRLHMKTSICISVGLIG
jgi:hypothetical protein